MGASIRKMCGYVKETEDGKLARWVAGVGKWKASLGRPSELSISASECYGDDWKKKGYGWYL
jgi:hypothetical protein